MSIIDKAQCKMSKLQETPVVGPLVVSPMKALASAVQMVTGAAFEILFGTLATIAETFGQNKLAKSFDALCYAGVEHRSKGMLNLLSASVNMLTLGLLGKQFEEAVGLRFTAAKL